MTSFSPRARFWAILLVLISAGCVIQYWQRIGEAKVARLELKDFPTRIGAWQQAGTDHRFDAATESVLRADDYVERSYYRPDGRVASFYVGYYATQRNGATYHSPLNCLPGSGWTMTNPDQVTIQVPGRPGFLANKYTIQSDGHSQLMIYWYQGRGRAVASEYWGKIYTVLDSMRRHRSDGAMVRIVLEITGSEADTAAAAVNLAQEAAKNLPAYVPD